MKNKIVFIILSIIFIVLFAVWTSMKKHDEKVNPKEIAVSTTKNTAKNIVFNVSDYPDKIIEIKKEVLNNEKQYVITG